LVSLFLFLICQFIINLFRIIVNFCFTYISNFSDQLDWKGFVIWKKNYLKLRILQSICDSLIKYFSIEEFVIRILLNGRTRICDSNPFPEDFAQPWRRPSLRIEVLGWPLYLLRGKQFLAFSTFSFNNSWIFNFLEKVIIIKIELDKNNSRSREVFQLCRSSSYELRSNLKKINSSKKGKLG